MKILVAPNSFKECADSVEISEIIKTKLTETKSINPICKPLSDGGDGFLSVVKNVLDVVEVEITIDDQLNGAKKYKILIDEKTETGFLESALVIGLKCIEDKNRNPLLLSSALIGSIINQLSIEVNQSNFIVKNFLIGIGGTATIDLGIGACSQLGLTLFDKNDYPLLPTPENFNSVSRIGFKKPNLPFQIKCIVDVDTNLLGDPGAIEIYGEQKGASKNDLSIIKSGIENLINLISADNDLNIPQKLNGAGGGLASGLNIFFNAEMIRAKDFIRDYILHDLNLNEFDAVITGEGILDHQSFEGKGSGIILKLFEKSDIPIFLVNGSTNLPQSVILPENIVIINLTDFFKSKEESMINYHAGIKKATQIVLNRLQK